MSDIIKSVVLLESDWETLLAQLRIDHPLSVTLIREKMRRVLGYTVRDGHYNELYSTRIVYLDFFDEKKKIMFLLRYSDLIQKVPTKKKAVPNEKC